MHTHILVAPLLTKPLIISYFFFKQARSIQECINAHEKCREKEVLQKEVTNNASNRLIINTEYVQNLDKSDGSKPYDMEDTPYLL